MVKAFTFSNILEKIDELPSADQNLRQLLTYANEVMYKEAEHLSGKLEQYWSIAEREISEFQHRPDGRIQSIRHSAEVDRILYKLIPHPLKEKLGFKNLFYLSAAAAIHDQDLVLSLSKGPHHGKKHGTIGDSLLQQFRSVFGLDRFESKIIGALIQAHAKSVLSHIDDSFRRKEEIRFLASVFILADICHIYDRTSELVGMYRYKDKSPPAWAGTMSISSDWEISSDTINFEALPLTIEEYIATQESINYMNKNQLKAAAKRLLKNGGLPIQFSCKFDYTALGKEFGQILRKRSINKDEERRKISEAAKAFAKFNDFDGLKMLESFGKKIYFFSIPFLGNHRLDYLIAISDLNRAVSTVKLDSGNLCSKILLKNLESERWEVGAAILVELCQSHPEAVKILFGQDKAVHLAVKKLVKMKCRVIYDSKKARRASYMKLIKEVPEDRKNELKKLMADREKRDEASRIHHQIDYNDKDVYIKSFAICVAANLGLRQMNKTFLSILLDEDANSIVRNAAMEALCELGSQRMVKGIQEIAIDANRSNITRSAAICILGRIDKKSESMELLKGLRNSEIEEIAEFAARSIEKLSMG